MALAVVPCGSWPYRLAGSVAAVRRWLLCGRSRRCARRPSLCGRPLLHPRPPSSGRARGTGGRATERRRTRWSRPCPRRKRPENRLRTMNSTLGRTGGAAHRLPRGGQQNLAAFTYTVAHDLRTPAPAWAVRESCRSTATLSRHGRSTPAIQAAAAHMDAVLASISHLSWCPRPTLTPRKSTSAPCPPPSATSYGPRPRSPGPSDMQTASGSTATPALIRMR